jgi:hypothetical protein
MKLRILITVCLLSSLVNAQGKGGGGRPSGIPGGGSSGAGAPTGVGRPADAGRPSSGQPGSANSAATRSERDQQPLRDAQINGGAFRMLEQKTGTESR